MKLSIVGSDTLARTVRECCAKHFELNDENPDILWVCSDTPIAKDGTPDIETLLEEIRFYIKGISPSTLVLISSQIPVGTTAKMEKEFPGHTLAYSPENIRVKTAVEDFMNPGRVVVGIRTERYDVMLKDLFAPFTDNVKFCQPEDAEMIKSAINAYLGLSIAFANEIARICRAVAADVDAVSAGLRSDRRVSPEAPLRPGAPFGGGHLDRDLIVLTEVAKAHNVEIPLIRSIRDSNSIS